MCSMKSRVVGSDQCMSSTSSARRPRPATARSTATSALKSRPRSSVRTSSLPGPTSGTRVAKDPVTYGGHPFRASVNPRTSSSRALRMQSAIGSSGISPDSGRQLPQATSGVGGRCGGGDEPGLADAGLAGDEQQPGARLEVSSYDVELGATAGDPRWRLGAAVGGGGCEPELVEVRSVSVHGLDEELEGPPGGECGLGEGLGDGGVGDPGLAGEGAQGRPAGAVVEVVEGVDERRGAGRRPGPGGEVRSCATSAHDSRRDLALRIALVGAICPRASGTAGGAPDHVRMSCRAPAHIATLGHGGDREPAT